MHWLDEQDVLRGIGQSSKFATHKAQDAMPTASWNPVSWMTAKAIDASIDSKNKKKFRDALPAVAKGLNNYDKISKLLNLAGITGEVNKWATAQVLFETNNLKSRVSSEDNNYSGIKWINKPYQAATKGRKSTEGNFYAHYSSPTAWAKDYKRILQLGGQNAPLKAGTLQEFVTRLHNNHYFTSNPSLYLQGLQVILQAKKDAPGVVKAYEKATGEKVNLKKGTTGKTWFRDHPIWTGVLVIAGGVVVIKAVSN